MCVEKEEDANKANEFVALKAPVFSSQTDLGIAG
jgi:hypothetical protein